METYYGHHIILKIKKIESNSNSAFYLKLSKDSINFNDLDKYLNKLKSKKCKQKGFIFNDNGVFRL
ncbi:MAG: hypothetical protein ACRC0Y_13975 [Fusobacteriaceae bacterium]